MKVGRNVSQLRASELTAGNSSCPRSQNCKPPLPGYNCDMNPSSLKHQSTSLLMDSLKSMWCFVADVKRWAMAETHLLKLARICITLAMSVSVREVRSAGYSCIRLNREGDMMAGHIKRRNREELMRLSARSSLPRSAHLALHEAKTSFSSRGNMLKPEHYFIAQC